METSLRISQVLLHRRSGVEDWVMALAFVYSFVAATHYILVEQYCLNIIHMALANHSARYSPGQINAT